MQTGLVIETYFDWGTASIGPYRMLPSYGYIEYYHAYHPTPDKHYLYKIMSEDKYVMAAVFINNAYVACLERSGSIYYYDIYNNVKRLSAETGYSVEGADYIPIGYERTSCKCQSVFFKPAMLTYSISKRAVLIDGRWVPIMEDVGILRKDDMQLYKELLNRNCRYMYLTEGGEYVWKD